MSEVRILTDREKVCAWLDSINEQDPAMRHSVMDACAEDPEARKYYVRRWEQDCNVKITLTI